MPIDLLNMTQAAPKVTYTPKFFSKKLTGNSFGSNNSVLNHFINPSEIKYTNTSIEMQDKLESSLTDEFDDAMRIITTSVENNSTVRNETIQLLPLYNIDYDNLQLCGVMDDQLGQWQPLGDGLLQIRFIPECLQLTQKQNPLTKKWTCELLPMYKVQVLKAKDLTDFKTKQQDKLDMDCLTVWTMTDPNDTELDAEYQPYFSNFMNADPTQVKFLEISTINPKAIVNYLSNWCASHNLTQYQLDLLHYLKTYNLYDAISQVSKSFQTNILFFIKLVVNDSSALYQIFKNINSMLLPLNQYQKIYKYIIKANIDPSMLDNIINSNLNLRFNYLLTKLNNMKSQLAPIPNHNLINDKLSLEQQNAVKSSSPLTLVEAGAGTGKSSVLLNRIKYLLDGNVDSEDILILSFTNAAAQHIKDLYPDIKSMTINALVNQIYQANYQKQCIVSARIFVNSLKIEYRNKKLDNFMSRFLKAMIALSGSNESDFLMDSYNFNLLDSGFQDLITLIKEDPQKIINTCTKLGQTTFDIQMAICYCGIDQLNLPQDITAKHILVDEVQDNSTFDFMFLLQYVIHEKASFFIVGDASQTLYAFRNANPYALNVLRTSDLFNIFQLTINFRSKASILTYANVLLNQIQANEFANIQLKANLLSQPTVDDFRLAVKVHHVGYSYKELEKDLLTNIALKKYIDTCLSRNEQVTFLAFSHAVLNIANKALTTLYGNSKYVFTDISSKRIRETCNFSDFWANITKSKMQLYASTIKSNLLYKIKQDFLNQRQYSFYQRVATKQWYNLMLEHGYEITNLMNKYIINQISFKQMIKRLIGIMVRYEINQNMLTQHMQQANNQPEVKQSKMKNSNFIFSTVHSAKGLEFDNVVFIESQNTRGEVTSEADKRTTYVALTRAKKSEYVITADECNTDDSQLIINYQLALNNLDNTINKTITL